MIYSNRLLKALATLSAIRYSKNSCERNFSASKDQEARNNSANLQYDVKEVEKLEAHAKIWWDIKGKMKGLHAMNELRVQLIRNGLVQTQRISVSDVEGKEKYLSGVQILDVGCGGGILSVALARLGAKVTGIDPSKELITLASNYAKNNSEGFPSPNYVATTVEAHSLENQHIYDAVVASEVIEHVSNKESFVKGCIRALKPSGSIFFTTPNRTFLSWLGNIVAGEYICRALPKNTHQYDKFITHDELSNMLEKEGCKTLLVNGMFYNIIRNKWLWTKSTSLSYALHAVNKNEY